MRVMPGARTSGRGPACTSVLGPAEPFASSGRTFRLRGYGMPRVKGGGAGDHLVTVKIVMPTELTPAERELYERLRTLRADSPRGYTQG